MMHLRKTTLILVILLFLSQLAVFQFVPKVNADYVIDRNVVYIDDENVYIAIYPHTSTGGWVYLNFTSKKYNGTVDLAFGFNSNLCSPRSAELYNPHNETIVRNYTIPERYFTNITFFKANWTFKNKDATWLYDGQVWLWHNETIYDNKTGETIGWEWILDWTHTFMQANKNTKTIFWTETYHVDWVNLARRLDWKIINYEHGGMNKWYCTKAEIQSNKLYHLKIWLDVTPSLNGTTTKYWFAIKPANETIAEAIINGHFYVLDPWYDTNWSYRKSHVINPASGAGTNYQVRIVVWNTTGTDSGENVYLDDKVRDDFGDVRFTDDDGVTLLDYWLDNYNSSAAVFWVEVADDLSSSSGTIYIYYGNPSATTTSNHDATFKSISDVSSVEYEFECHSTNAGDPKVAFCYYDGSSVVVPSQETVYTDLPTSDVVFSVTKTVDATHKYLYDGVFSSEGTSRTDDARIRLDTETGNTYVDRVWLIAHYSDGSESPPIKPVFAECYNVADELWHETTSDVQDSDDVYCAIGTSNPLHLNVLWEVTSGSQLRKYVSPEPSHGSWGSEETPVIQRFLTASQSATEKLTRALSTSRMLTAFTSLTESLSKTVQFSRTLLDSSKQQ